MARLPFLGILVAFAVMAPSVTAEDQPDLGVIHRIKLEAFDNSQVMDHLFYLTDVNGPRLTNSPGFHSAVEWCLKRLKELGLENVHTEKWDFGKGWSYSNFSIDLVEPVYAPLVGFPLAWTPGTGGALTAEPILAVMKKKEDFDKHKGKLKGKIVLIDEPRKLELSVEPIGKRFSEEDLAGTAQAPEPKKREEEEDRDEEKEFAAERNRFLAEEGAAAALRISYKGSGGFVAGTRGGSQKPDEPVPPPMVVLAPEHYNRIARLLEKKVPVRVRLNYEARFYEDDPNSVNVLAEIPGGKKKDEVVMLGGHLDSWHGGTGAADNAAGVAVAIEVVRVLKALNLPMDRTVRIALWGGEEQGLLGSKAYVKDHFANPDDMVVMPEHAKLSGYFNFDNGSGKIRGIYLQGNDMLRPLFEAWLKPFHDLGADTVTIRDTRGTDHLSFDEVGLPGFQFIQDPLEYSKRTHHSNVDVYDHMQPGDLMEASAIIASFVYQTVVRDEMLPREPLPKPKPKKDEQKEKDQKAKGAHVS